MIPLYNRQVLSIDSRSRDDYELKTGAGAWVTQPNSYTVRFPPIRNIKQMNLISTEIPNTEYVINATNNIITFDAVAGGAPFPGVTATLTPGTYTAAEMANEINRQMNAAVGGLFGAFFVATYITWTQKVRIDAVAVGDSFRIYWTAALSPRIQLGFDDRDMAAPATTVSSDNVVNLAGENFIYLTLKNLLNSEAVRGTEVIENSFAKIIFNTAPHTYTFDSYSANPVIFPVPINQLNRLEVEFRKHDRTLYDFNRVEHSFTLEFFTTM